MTPAQKHLKRLPLVNKFLSKRARAFNPSKDRAIETCAICLDGFKENNDREISELSCDSKHIFHLACVTEWVKKKDVCPLCM